MNSHNITNESLALALMLVVVAGDAANLLI